MRFSVLLLYVLPAFLCCAPSGQVQADYDLRGLKGPVRQVVARHYQMRYDGAGERLLLGVVAITRFDGAGRLAELKYYDEKNQLVSSSTFSRGRDGRLSAQKNWSRSGKLEDRVEYLYDPKGRLASETYFSADGRETGSYAYEYDALGRPKRRLMETIYSQKDRRSGYTHFEYDAAGRRSEERYYEQALGGLSSRTVYTYEGDRLASSADYTYGTQLANRVFYKHDPAGNRTREAIYWLPEEESARRYDAITREQDLPKSFLRSVVEYEYSCYEK
jgi:YD repeat-containing protein